MAFYNPVGSTGLVTSSFLASQGIFPSPGAQVLYVGNSTTLTLLGIGSSNGNSGLSPTEPMNTLFGTTGALTKCVSGRGDVVIILPGHSETITAVGTTSVNDVQIVGCQTGNARPIFLVNGAVDLFSLTGNNILLANLQLSLVTTDAATAFVNIAGSGCKLSNLLMIGSDTGINVVDAITLATGSNSTVIENCIGFNTTVAINSWISIEAAVARCNFRGNTFRGDLVTAGIIDSATATQLIIENNKIVTIGTNIPGCILDSNPTGQAYGNHMYGTDATIANNAQWGTALILGDNFTRGGTGSSVSASDVIPALDT